MERCFLCHRKMDKKQDFVQIRNASGAKPLKEKPENKTEDNK